MSDILHGSQYEAFRKRFKVSVQIQRIAFRPDADPDPASDNDAQWLATAHHYVATLSVAGRAVPTLPFATFYSQGSAHKSPPTPDAVLWSLASDCRGADASFEEWASEIGWDTDSRRAERTYEAIQRTRRGLLRLLGRDAYAALIAIDEEV